MTPGKYRHLGRCATEEGHFVALALDHRDNLRSHLKPVDDAEFVAFKSALLRAGRSATAVLVDPAFGFSGGFVRAGAGLLMPLEVTDYSVHPSERPLRRIPGWSVEKLKRVGGDGVKLLLPYHPALPDRQAREDEVAAVGAECRRFDVPFFLEPIACSPGPARKLDHHELLEVMLGAAELFPRLGVDVMKVQYPGSAEGCKQFSQACRVPWVLLSGGVTFKNYVNHVEEACRAGASGVIAGRAVWAEASGAPVDEREAWMQEFVPRRLKRLARLVGLYATPWTSRVAAPELGLDWFEGY